MSGVRTRRLAPGADRGWGRPLKVIVAITGCLVFTCACTAREAPYDLIVRGGYVLDGTGEPGVNADIGVRGGRVATIGELADATAGRVIDAGGLVVTPGFIDLHTHSEDTLPADGNAESQVRQGVTLALLSEGRSPGPIGSEAARAALQQSMGVYGVDVTWTSLDEYFALLMKQGISLNAAAYVAASQVQLSVMEYKRRDPTAEELERMKGLVAEAMEQGAIGIHGGSAELAAVAHRYGGGYYRHIRSEGYELVESIQEVIQIAEKTGIPVHIFHFKVRGRPLWGQLDKPIALIEEARARGLKVTANQYPYTAMQHPVWNVFPRWVEAGGPKGAFVARLKDPATRAKIKRDPDFLAYVEEHGGWENIHASVIRSEKNKQFEGKSIAEIARERGMADPADACMDLLSEEEDGWVGGVHFAMSEEDVRRIMQLPWVSIASDGRALATEGILAQGKPHPRSFGTNPRVLGKYVREEKLLTLEDAVRKMTGLPASILGLKDRGLLKEGMAADIVVFDRETVVDKATFQDPHQYAGGIPYVIVNGVVVIDGGQHTGARPGQIVRGPGYQGERTGRETE